MSLQPHSIPKDGFAGTGHGAGYTPTTSLSGFNSTTEDFPVGTKVRYHNDVLGGFGTCIYLKYDNGAAVETIPGAFVKSVLVKGSVSGDIDSHVGNGSACAIGIVADGNYGWFWCGGVCPDITVLASATETRLSAVNAVTSNAVTAAADFKLNSVDLQITISHEDDIQGPAGYALADDSTTSLALGLIVLYDNWG